MPYDLGQAFSSGMNMPAVAQATMLQMQYAPAERQLSLEKMQESVDISKQVQQENALKLQELTKQLQTKETTRNEIARLYGSDDFKKAGTIDKAKMVAELVGQYDYENYGKALLNVEKAAQAGEQVEKNHIAVQQRITDDFVNSVQGAQTPEDILKAAGVITDPGVRNRIAGYLQQVGSGKMTMDQLKKEAMWLGLSTQQRLTYELNEKKEADRKAEKERDENRKEEHDRATVRYQQGLINKQWDSNNIKVYEDYLKQYSALRKQYDSLPDDKLDEKKTLGLRMKELEQSYRDSMSLRGAYVPPTPDYSGEDAKVDFGTKPANEVISELIKISDPVERGKAINAFLKQQSVTAKPTAPQEASVSYEDFQKEAKSKYPQYTDEQIRAAYDKAFGKPTEQKPAQIEAPPKPVASAAKRDEDLSPPKTSIDPENEYAQAKELDRLRRLALMKENKRKEAERLAQEAKDAAEEEAKKAEKRRKEEEKRKRDKTRELLLKGISGSSDVTWKLLGK